VNRLARIVGDRALPWLVPALLLAVWQIGARQGVISQRFLPAPSDVAIAFWHMVGTGELWRDMGVSTARALAGFAVGGSIGFVLGVLNGTSPVAARLLDSSLQMLRNIPHLAMIPLVILWFGIDESAKLFLVSVGVFFPIYLNTYHGVRTVDAGLLEMAESYGLDRWRLFRQVILPGALPSILVGFRYGLGIMWLTLIVAETISASSGIGYMTMNAREFLQTDIVVLGILIYALLGKAADWAAHRLELYCLAWHPAFRAEAAA
jgi:sulfonate transport system permease protein